jgi:hypothetical protein
MSGFTIDALPYPNDPSQAPRTGVTLEEATHLCEARKARLCTELEWEAACRGPDGDEFSTGAGWDPECAGKPETCASGYGVRAMGAIREWTSSVVEAVPERPERPALRGGGIGAAGGPRCARRARALESRASNDLGFRCCAGPPPAMVMPAVIVQHHRFRKSNLEPDAIARLVAASPELARVGTDAALFDPGDKPYLTRSKADQTDVTFTTLPLLWSPEPGAEFLVAAGHGKAGSFVAAWWPLPSGEYRLASSFVMIGEVAPVALAYKRTERTLWWTSCWQCPAETGHVSLRDDHRVVIVEE